MNVNVITDAEVYAALAAKQDRDVYWGAALARLVLAYPYPEDLDLDPVAP